MLETKGKSTKRRVENREVRRLQLIKATISSIAELGFADTTQTAVANRAGLSHGTVNFHFKSKEALFTETLGHLAQEHYENWTAAIAKADRNPASRLVAMLEVDFDPEIASLEKLSVWFAFWGQVKYRPAYSEVHSTFDGHRFEQMATLCADIIADGGYANLEGESVARRIEAFVDGLWLNLLLYPESEGIDKARDDIYSFLVQLFPRHFAFTDEGCGLTSILGKMIVPCKAGATTDGATQ